MAKAENQADIENADVSFGRVGGSRPYVCCLVILWLREGGFQNLW
jgi:hypothetical protein